MATDELRAFLALEIPDSVRRALAVHQRRWRQELPPCRWVKPENQHLTLKFLGQTPVSLLDRMSSDLRSALAGCGEISVSLTGTGCFPAPRRPRVLWIGGSAAGVELVVEAVQEVAGACGFAKEQRPWAIHLTQARVRKPWPAAAVERFFEEGRDLRFQPFQCTEVVLFSSLLQPGGAVYTALERISLA